MSTVYRIEIDIRIDNRTQSLLPRSDPVTLG